MIVLFRLRDNGEVDIPFNNKVGTKRYMAPELLDESINENIFDCWKRADVYSLGLVYWELARRCEHSQTRAEEYQMPYYQDVNSDPSIEDMKEVVCDRRIRPLIPPTWDQFEVGSDAPQYLSKPLYSTSRAFQRIIFLKLTIGISATENPGQGDEGVLV